MPEFTLRAANQEDFATIRRLIWSVRINPAQLDWRRFVVAVDPSGKILGCGQLKTHSGGILELASIAVHPAYRSHGIARAIIEHLIQGAPRPIYLTCRSGLESFYNKWDFRAINGEDLPQDDRRLIQLVAVISPLSPIKEKMLVMRLL